MKKKSGKTANLQQYYVADLLATALTVSSDFQVSNLRHFPSLSSYETFNMATIVCEFLAFCWDDKYSQDIENSKLKKKRRNIGITSSIIAIDPGLFT